MAKESTPRDGGLLKTDLGLRVVGLRIGIPPLPARTVAFGSMSTNPTPQSSANVFERIDPRQLHATQVGQVPALDGLTRRRFLDSSRRGPGEMCPETKMASSWVSPKKLRPQNKHTEKKEKEKEKREKHVLYMA